GIDAAFERCKKMHDELKNKVEDAFEKAKINPRLFQEYVSTPTNFAQADWSAIQKTRQEIKKKLDDLLPKKTEEEETPGVVSKEKRKKTTFLSKKRWLSMH
ncbi:MAG: hypothetical protein JWO53_748, partial [Chlamydiia bacterium]|nr:hypothetical protein [Chlamydiia bacterium]